MKMPGQKFNTCFLITLGTAITSLFFPTFQPIVQAQNKSAFDRTRIGMHYLLNTNRNEFHQFWQPGTGTGMIMEMPFYYGHIYAEVNYLYYSSRDVAITNFQFLSVYAGLAKKFTLFRKLEWLNGVGMGNNFMRFNDEEMITGVKYESEFGVTFRSRFSIPIFKRWHFDLTGSHCIIFTLKRIKLSYVAGGISYEFTTPRWLKEFLQ